MHPRLALIRRFVDSVTRTAAREAPRHATKLPDARIDDVRMLRVERHVGDAALGTNVERLLPRASAVGRAIDAARGRIPRYPRNQSSGRPTLRRLRNYSNLPHRPDPSSIRGQLHEPEAARDVQSFRRRAQVGGRKVREQPGRLS